MEKRLENKVAIITGASSGIGRATALLFAKHGAKVAVSDVNEEGGNETVELIKKAGGEAVFIKCDVSKEEEVRQMVNTAVEKFGKLDYAFNNAGIESKSLSTVDCDEDIWDCAININLKGVWLCMKNEIPHMLRNGGGSIVNNASIAGLVGFANAPAYVASKHGVNGLTKAAALDYAAKNVRINSVCPGVINTPMVERAVKGNKELETQLEQGEPVGRLGKPEEIAEAVLFLCSDASSFITGINMPVDGGWTAR